VRTNLTDLTGFKRRNDRSVGGVTKSQLSDQIVNMHTQSVGHDFQRMDGHITFAALNFSHVSAVQAGTVGEHILGPAPPHAEGPYVCANFLLNLLHSPQFGGTLVKSIQVISCIPGHSSACAQT
jgi:hypothetical protein